MKIPLCVQVPLALVTILNIVGFPSEASGYQLTSRTGHLKIEFSSNSKCLPNRSSATYSTSQGITGVLYPDCSWNTDAQDLFKFNFIDTSGKERCQGRMALMYGGREGITSVWYFDTAVSGHKCSVIGQKVSIDGMLDKVQSSAQLTLQPGAYSLYSKHIIIVKNQDKLCYVGLHRQNASVGSLIRTSQSSNVYNIYGFDKKIELAPKSRTSLMFANSEYTANPNYDLSILNYIPEAQECLSVKQPYYKLIQNRFR